MMQNWQGKRVLILGAARQGLALARYLARHGAQVTLNDRRNINELSEAMDALSDIKVSWTLGGHPLSLLDEADCLAVSGGVPLDNPLVVAATQHRLQLTNDTQVFLDAAPCKTVGITGSAGKTTTTTLVGRIAALDGGARYQHAWVGGNIGDPIINYLDQMSAKDIAILEISSFQLEQLTVSPDIAAVLNITPNHLDRHGTMKAYIAAKRRILEFQSGQDVAVLGRDDTGAWSLSKDVKGRLLSFGFSNLPKEAEGVLVRDGMFVIRADGQESILPVADVIELRGEHNRLNVLAACAIAFAAGFSADSMRAGISGFKGAPHRLELVRDWRGTHWYNDSIATAPERSMAAIHSFTDPIVLMLGGRDKNLPWESLAELVRERVDHVVLFGESAQKIRAALGPLSNDQRPYSVVSCEGLQQAVQSAAQVAQPGDVILFSPGGTSFDEFKDFEERGECFRKWVHELS